MKQGVNVMTIYIVQEVWYSSPAGRLVVREKIVGVYDSKEKAEAKVKSMAKQSSRDFVIRKRKVQ